MAPGELGQGLVDLGQPRALGIGGELQRRVAGVDETLGRPGHLHALQVAVVADHVGDRRRHHRPAAGQVFRRLGRADELGGVVDGEGHQGHVPARQIGRQVGVGLAAQVADVGPLGQVGGVDLHHRSDDAQGPVRPGVGQVGQEPQVHPLVDHAVEAQARAGQGGLILGLLRRVPGAGLGEVRAVDARGEGMDVGVLALLGLVEAVAAGEHHVGLGHQGLLQLAQLGRGELEVAELVHAVIDDRRGLDVAREAEHHRGVVPADRAADLLGGHQPVEQGAERPGAGLAVQRLGQARRGHDHPALGAHLEVQPGRVVERRGHRFLPEDHPPAGGEPRHQMLRALEHEVPPQVRKADQRFTPLVDQRGGMN